MLLNTFSRKKDEKLWRIKMAVSKCPCLTLSRVNVMLDAKVSLVPTQLAVPSTLLAPATTSKHTKPQRYIWSNHWHMSNFFKIAQQKRVFIAGVSYPLSSFLFLPIPYPFRYLLLRLTTPPRIRLLAHNFLAHDKFNKYSIFFSPPPPREITINSLTLNLKTWCYRYKEQSTFVWPTLNNLENDQVFINTSISLDITRILKLL